MRRTACEILSHCDSKTGSGDAADPGICPNATCPTAMSSTMVRPAHHEYRMSFFMSSLLRMAEYSKQADCAHGLHTGRRELASGPNSGLYSETTFSRTTNGVLNERRNSRGDPGADTPTAYLRDSDDRRGRRVFAGGVPGPAGSN